jgi:hypothetical protein
MITSSRKALGAKGLRVASVGLLLLSLAILVGCQGFSSSKPATQVQSGGLLLASASLDFGSVKVGASKTLTLSASNNGTAPVTISSAAISTKYFSLSGPSLPVTIAAGQNFTFSVVFTPNAAGAFSATISISSDATNGPASVSLSGTGTTATGQLTATPATLGVGNVVVGTSGTVSGSLNASGASVTVIAASSNNSRFTVGGLTLPVTIPAGRSAAFTLTFSPQVAGGAGATLTFTSDAQPSTTTDTATGTGTTAPSYSVNLSWNASTSPNISGYNIYRAVYSSGSCGSYAKINGSNLVTSTAYTDASVVDGTAYCYATTAVNSANEESSYSNIASNVQIPAA